MVNVTYPHYLYNFILSLGWNSEENNTSLFLFNF